MRNITLTAEEYNTLRNVLYNMAGIERAGVVRRRAVSPRMRGRCSAEINLAKIERVIASIERVA